MSTVIAKNVQIGTSGTSTDNFTIFQPATPDGTLRIGNGNTGITTSQVALTSAGNVGIGTSSPASQLDVSKTGDATFSVTSAGVQRYQLITRSGGNFEVYDQSSAATRIAVTQAGNVGIGTSSPSTYGQLAIYRNTTDGTNANVAAVNAGTTASYAGFQATAGTVNWQVFSDAAGNAVGTPAAMIRTISNHPLLFGTNNTERARIDSSGNLLSYKTQQVTTSSSATYGTATFYTRLTSSTSYTLATGTGLSQDTVVTATLEYVNLYSYADPAPFAYGLRQAALRGSAGGSTTAGNLAIVNQTSGSGAAAPTFAWTGTSTISLTVTNPGSNEGWARVTVTWRNVTMSLNPVA